MLLSEHIKLGIKQPVARTNTQSYCKVINTSDFYHLCSFKYMIAENSFNLMFKIPVTYFFKLKRDKF